MRTFRIMYSVVLLMASLILLATWAMTEASQVYTSTNIGVIMVCLMGFGVAIGIIKYELGQ